MTDDSTRFSGTVPEFYDKGLGPVLFARCAEIVAERLASFSPENLLETAAGTGIVTRALRDRLPASSSIVATDLNESMLEVARRKFAPNERVRFQVEDATKLTVADRSFDAVVCQFGVMFFPDKEAGYREVGRILEPGGRYVFSVWDSLAFNPLSRVVQEALEERFPADPPPFLMTPYGYAAVDPIKASLIEAGFRDIRIDILPLDPEIPNLRLFAEGWAIGSPLTEQIRSRGVDPVEFTDFIESNLRRALGDSNRAPLQAILFDARLSR
jgi:SAM-dependent methyltransferase